MVGDLGDWELAGLEVAVKLCSYMQYCFINLVDIKNGQYNHKAIGAENSVLCTCSIRR